MRLKHLRIKDEEFTLHIYEINILGLRIRIVFRRKNKDTKKEIKKVRITFRLKNRRPKKSKRKKRF